MKAINKQKVDLENGVYNALWSGYNMQIMIPNKENIYVETLVGVRGFNCKTIVEIKDGILSVVMDKNNKNENIDNIDKEIPISDVKERLCLGNFTINKPEKFDLENVKLEIKNYDYDSTSISIDELRILHAYIGHILNSI
jgi:hypothetical protein